MDFKNKVVAPITLALAAACGGQPRDVYETNPPPVSTGQDEMAIRTIKTKLYRKIFLQDNTPQDKLDVLLAGVKDAYRAKEDPAYARENGSFESHMVALEGAYRYLLEREPWVNHDVFIANVGELGEKVAGNPDDPNRDKTLAAFRNQIESRLASIEISLTPEQINTARVLVQDARSQITLFGKREREKRADLLGNPADQTAKEIMERNTPRSLDALRRVLWEQPPAIRREVFTQLRHLALNNALNNPEAPETQEFILGLNKLSRLMFRGPGQHTR